jgi:hypothetical protein
MPTPGNDHPAAAPPQETCGYSSSHPVLTGLGRLPLTTHGLGVCEDQSRRELAVDISHCWSRHTVRQECGSHSFPNSMLKHCVLVANYLIRSSLVWAPDPSSRVSGTSETCVLLQDVEPTCFCSIARIAMRGQPLIALQGPWCLSNPPPSEPTDMLSGQRCSLLITNFFMLGLLSSV